MVHFDDHDFSLPDSSESAPSSRVGTSRPNAAGTQPMGGSYPPWSMGGGDATVDTVAESELDSVAATRVTPAPDAFLQGPLLDFGLELAGLGLSADEESRLDQHSKEALEAARSMRAHKLLGGEGEPETEAEARLDAHSKVRRGGPPRSRFKPFQGLDELPETETEAILHPQIKARGRSRGGLLSMDGGTGFESGADEASLDSGCGAPAAPSPGLIPAADHAAEGNHEYEAMPAAHGRSTRGQTIDASYLPSMDDGMEMKLETESAPDAIGKSSAPSSWVAFGIELDGLGLSTDEEAQLDPTSKAALTTARVMRSRLQPTPNSGELPESDSDAPGPGNTGHPRRGAQAQLVDGRASGGAENSDSEAGLGGQGTRSHSVAPALLPAVDRSFGELDTDVEPALDPQSRIATRRIPPPSSW
eukprot:6273367-Prymnesium_polylepis.1